MSRNVIADVLDLLALLALAFAASAALFPLLGLASIAAGGMVLFLGARLIDWLHDTGSNTGGGD